MGERLIVSLTPSQVGLLTRVLERQAPELATRYGRLSFEATVDELRRLQDVVAREVVDSGLLANGEPNQHGLAVEDLIDALSPYRQ